MSKIQKKSKKADITKSMTSKIVNLTSIHKLNDDCLYKIFMELPIENRMVIERVCKRWQNVSQQSWPDIKNVKLSQHPTTWIVQVLDSSKHGGRYRMSIRAVEKLLICCGRFLTRLSVHLSAPDHSHILSLMAKHCYNVTKLILHLKRYPKNELKKLFSRCQKLEYVEMKNLEKKFTGNCLHELPKETITEIQLEVNGTSFYDGFPRSGVEAICNFSNLHTLGLNEFVLESEALKRICEKPALINVSFTKCHFPRSINLLTNLSHVERLNLRNIREVSDQFLSRLTTSCTHLKHLDISHCTEVSDLGIDLIAKFRRIESLLMNSLCYVTDRHLGRMVTLNILECEECLDVNNRGIIALIENARNLKYLNIEDTNVTWRALRAANRIILQRTNGLKLKIKVNSSMMDDWGEVPSPFLEIE